MTRSCLSSLSCVNYEKMVITNYKEKIVADASKVGFLEAT